MKKFWGTTILLLAVITATMAGNARALEVKSISSKQLQAMIQAHKGRVILVAYWTTWCSSCRQEISFLNEIYRSYPRDQVWIIGVSLDKERVHVDQFMKQVECKYDVYWVPEEHAQAFKDIVTLPTLVFFRKNGKKGWSHKGLMFPEQLYNTIDIFVHKTE